MNLHHLCRFVLVFVLCAFMCFTWCFAVEREIITENPQEFTYTVISADEIRSSDDWELVDVSLRSVVSPVDPSDTSGLKAALLGVLGSYDPVVVEYQYQNANQQYYSYLREIQPDYVWVWSCVLLIVFIWCLFRLGGAIICRR